MTILDNHNNNQIDQNSATNKFEVSQPFTDKPYKQDRKPIILALLIFVLFLCGGVYAIYIKNNIVKNGKSVSPNSVPIQPTTKPTLAINKTSLIGKWEVVSVEENGVVIVPQGNRATIEFWDDGTYQALGGCNEMEIRTYETGLDFKLSIKASGTKKKCGKQIVEFHDLRLVYAYEFEENNLLLHYKTQDGLNGFFQLQKTNSDSSINPIFGWKTYTNTQDNYSFKYPTEWKLFIEESLPIIVNLSHLNKTDNKKWAIKIRLIPQDQLGLMGITYCGAYPEDNKRCEIIPVNNINGTIDWGSGTNDEYTATAEIPFNKGIISLTLTPVNPETKKILYQILSTFKFLK